MSVCRHGPPRVVLVQIEGEIDPDDEAQWGEKALGWLQDTAKAVRVLPTLRFPCAMQPRPAIGYIDPKLLCFILPG